MFQVSEFIRLSFQRPFSSIESPGPSLQLNYYGYVLPDLRVFYRSTNNTEILNEFARIINGAVAGIESYQPTLAVIVTWEVFVSMYQSFL